MRDHGIDAQRTTQLENRVHRLFPLPLAVIPLPSDGVVIAISFPLDIITFLLFWMLSSWWPAALRLECVSVGSQAWLFSGTLHP